jgi:hypothetical protein
MLYFVQHTLFFVLTEIQEVKERQKGEKEKEEERQTQFC